MVYDYPICAVTDSRNTKLHRTCCSKLGNGVSNCNKYDISSYDLEDDSMSVSCQRNPRNQRQIW